MKKSLIILFGICVLLNGISVFAQETSVPSCGCQNQTKCLDLITSMYNERATLYNVLNLSNDQLKCKDVIDKKRYEELGANSVNMSNATIGKLPVHIWTDSLNME